MDPHLYKEKCYSISVTMEPEYLEEFIVIMEYFVTKVREEEGNIFYHVMRNTNEENKFMFLGLWKDDAAAQVHMDSEYFKTYVPQMGRMFESFTQLELDKFL